MNLELRRRPSGSKATIGELYVNGLFECYTLEDVVREVDGQPVASWKIQDETAIPRGVYTVIINHSDHFNKDLPLLLSVAGFSGVRIHSGNKDTDTEGCLLVGQTIVNDDFIGGSRAAFDHLFSQLQAAIANGEIITISVGLTPA